MLTETKLTILYLSLERYIPIAQSVLEVRNEGKNHEIVNISGSDLVDSMA
jgi:hypothetical protein